MMLRARALASGSYTSTAHTETTTQTCNKLLLQASRRLFLSPEVSYVVFKSHDGSLSTAPALFENVYPTH